MVAYLLAGGELPLHSGPAGDWRSFARSTCYLEVILASLHCRMTNTLYSSDCLDILRSRQIPAVYGRNSKSYNNVAQLPVRYRYRYGTKQTLIEHDESLMIATARLITGMHLIVQGEMSIVGSSPPRTTRMSNGCIYRSFWRGKEVWKMRSGHGGSPRSSC